VLKHVLSTFTSTYEAASYSQALPFHVSKE